MTYAGWEIDSICSKKEELEIDLFTKQIICLLKPSKLKYWSIPNQIAIINRASGPSSSFF